MSPGAREEPESEGQLEVAVKLDSDQRTVTFRRNHGWVKTKRCMFCNTMCHIDQPGIWSFGTFFESRHFWFCGVQCAKGLSYQHLKQHVLA